jgi:predicted PurR-regulated permease PerM
MDGKSLIAWLFSKMPLFQEVQVKITTSFQNIVISVVWATLAAATSQALVIFIGFVVLNVPAAFFAAGTTFIFAWIPVIGSTPVWVAAALYLHLHSTLTKVVLMTIVGISAGLIDNLVRPYVLKGRGDMHPLLSLIAIFGGIHIFQLFGVFIGPIVAAILVSILDIWPHVGRRAGIKFDNL